METQIGEQAADFLEHAARTAHYSAEEVNTLAFEGARPDAGDLSRRWRRQLTDARAVVGALPGAEAGECVLARDGRLFRGLGSTLSQALEPGELQFHAGSIRGAFPQLRPPV